MSEQYNSSDIKALGDLQAIRTRAGMYVGETNHPGQLFTEALDNALDEVQSGFSDKAVVTIDTTKNLYSVRDYGRGIPIGKSTYTDAVSGESHEIETLQLVYFKTHAGGKFGNNTAYKKSRGMHGVGLKCINALSVHAKAVTYRDGKSVILVMSKGELISLDYEDTTEPNGVYVEFIPDPDIFESPIIPINHILEISGISKAFGQHVEVYEDGTELELPYSNLYDLLPTQSNENELLRTDFTVESPTTESMTIALKYTSDTNVIYRGYTNMIPNPSGGSHLRFFEDCYKEAWNKYLDDEFRINDVLIGLRALVGVAIDNDVMAFAGQTKERLTTSKSYFEQFRSELVSKIQEYFDTHENERKGLIKRFKEYRASQNKLLANKELSQLIYINDTKGQSSSVRRKSVVDKLRECTSKSQQDTELIICFTKDMRVKLLDGTTPTFEELVSMEKTNPGRNYYVYSVDESGHTVVGRGYNPRITRYVDEIAHVILDDGTEIKCTKDHLFMMTDGHYEEAQNLKVGDSLCARYFKYCDDPFYNTGKEMFFEPNEDRWVFTHQFVMGEINDAHSGESGWHIHHKDFNQLNNDPSNLEWLTSYEHKRIHAIKGKQALIKYNSSQKHIDDMKRAWNDPEKAKLMSQPIINYNKSEKHRQSASKVGKVTGSINIKKCNESGANHSDIQKLHEKQSKVLNTICYLITNKMDFTETNYTTYRFRSALQYSRIPEVFSSYEEAYSKALKLVNAGEYTASETYLYDGLIMQKQRAGKLISKLKFDGLKFNESNYESNAFNREPLYSDLPRLFGSYSEAEVYASTYNHKVAKVWIEQLDHLEPMYDFTVENYHNFVMPNEDNTSGIVVHQCEGDSAAGTLIQARDVVHQAIIPIRGKILNVSKKNSYIECMKNEEVKSIVNSAGTGIGADCDYTKSRYERYLIFTDADADGLNIASLLISIFVNLMPDLVVNGMVYVVIPPLYSWVDKGVRYYTNDISQVTNLQTMTRYKGLGEMDPAEMFDSCLDKGKQRLIQVEYPNNIDDFNESMTSSAMRYKILEGLGLIKEISI